MNKINHGTSGNNEEAGDLWIAYENLRRLRDDQMRVITSQPILNMNEEPFLTFHSGVNGARVFNNALHSVNEKNMQSEKKPVIPSNTSENNNSNIEYENTIAELEDVIFKLKVDLNHSENRCYNLTVNNDYLKRQLNKRSFNL